jgi:hypothetical protein
MKTSKFRKHSCWLAAVALPMLACGGCWLGTLAIAIVS